MIKFSNKGVTVANWKLKHSLKIENYKIENYFFMTPERWQQIKGQVQDTFSDAEISKEKLPEPQIGDTEIILFTGPLGKMKLEYVTKPVLLDKKTHGSRRMGSEATVQYIFSETEFSHHLKAYKWDEAQDDWVEIDMRDSFKL